MTQLILASSSPYRKELLERLAIPFECISPDIDESQRDNEPPEAYVQRLAIEKAAKIGSGNSASLIIGSDQCSVNNKQILGKPKDRDHAIEQLKAASGTTVEFITGVCVTHPESDWQRQWVESFYVDFRELTIEEIERYLDIEKPFNCAGSFKSERLGASLCSAMRGNDPTALIGLPLIKLAESLREFGLNVP